MGRGVGGRGTGVAVKGTGIETVGVTAPAGELQEVKINAARDNSRSARKVLLVIAPKTG